MALKRLYEPDEDSSHINKKSKLVIYDEDDIPTGLLLWMTEKKHPLFDRQVITIIKSFIVPGIIKAFQHIAPITHYDPPHANFNLWWQTRKQYFPFEQPVAQATVGPCMSQITEFLLLVQHVLSDDSMTQRQQRNAIGEKLNLLVYACGYVFSLMSADAHDALHNKIVDVLYRHPFTADLVARLDRATFFKRRLLYD